MQDKGHEFFISARDKEVSLNLLNKYNIPYYNRGKGSANLLGKAFYMIKADLSLYTRAKIFKPDLFLSFAAYPFGYAFGLQLGIIGDFPGNFLDLTLCFVKGTLRLVPHARFHDIPPKID